MYDVSKKLSYNVDTLYKYNNKHNHKTRKK